MFDFVCLMRNVDFVHARQGLADRAGITIKTKNVRQAGASGQEHEVLEAAVQVWQSQLTPRLLRKVEEMWGVSRETAFELHLGYASTGLFKALRRRGFSRETILASKLFRKTSAGLRAYFRGRLIFTIVRHGRVVNLVGRQFPDVSDKGPKYLRLPNPQHGRPRPSLFNTDSVRARQPLILVEGYTDAAALHQLRYAVVALGGSRASANATRELARCARGASDLFLFFDFDDAGRESVVRLADALLRLGIHARVVSDPELQGDPADLIRRSGHKAKQAVETLLRRSKRLVDLRIQNISPDTPPGQLSSAVREVLACVAMLTPVAQDAHLNRLQKRFKLSRRALRRELRAVTANDVGTRKATGSVTIAPSQGVLGKVWFFVLPVENTSGDSDTTPVPHLVSSDRQFFALDDTAKWDNKKIRLRSKPFFTQEPSRWALNRVQKFLRRREERIDARQVYRNLKTKLGLYLEFQEPEVADYLAMWIMGTYLVQVFNAYPQLQVFGPKGSGKTKLLTFLDFVTFNAYMVMNIRPAGLFRVIEKSCATILHDEADRVTPRDNPDQVELYRAGYKRSGYVVRLEGPNFEPSSPWQK